MLKKVGKVDFKLNLPEIIKQHLIFYVFLFLKDSANLLFKQTYPKLKLIKINNNDDKEYKKNNIINIETIKKMIKI